MSIVNHSEWVLVRKVTKWFCRFIIVLFAVITVGLCAFRLLAVQREYLLPVNAAPAGGRFVRAHDVDIFIQELGPQTGKPVVLIHGTGAWSELWRGTMTFLAERGFRVIAVDLPPFGYSEKLVSPASYSRKLQARRIIGVIDELHMQGVILVAHSVGGRPSIQAAFESPDRIGRLVLVDPALGFVSSTGRVEPIDVSWITKAFFRIRPLRNAVLSLYGTNPMSTKHLLTSFISQSQAATDDRVKTLQRPLDVRGTTDAYGDWLEYLVVGPDNSETSFGLRFKDLRMPVSIIWGDSDSVTPFWQASELKKLIPGSRLNVIKGVGHIPYIEDTEIFNEILLNEINT